MSMLFTSRKMVSHLYTGVYVDDLIVIGANTVHIHDFKNKMMKLFEMSNLGLLNSHLGIEVIQGISLISLNLNLCSEDS